MATYKQIQAYVREKDGFVPQTCWIAHVKEMVGLPVEKAWNRKDNRRAKPCPPDKVEPIRKALSHYGMMP